MLKGVRSQFTVYDDAFRRIDIIRKLIAEDWSGKNAFYAMDLGYFVRMHAKWKQLLPRVFPFFAVKANNDPALLQMMSKLEFGFDCASMKEIEMIKNMGNMPSKIIYANTRKQPSHLEYASSAGVTLTTFDDEDELHKIKDISPNMRLLLRISTASFTKAACEGMTKKSGCDLAATNELLETAKRLRLKVQGVRYCKYSIKLAGVIRHALDNMFPRRSNVQIIAEPGTYFCMPSTVLVANIIGTRDCRHKSKGLEGHDQEIEYFINDGKQTSFMCYETVPGLKPVIEPVSEEHIEAPRLKCKVWGQTCDEDVIIESCQLPKMKTGDWIYSTDKGAYSSVFCSNFNGFGPPKVHRYISESLMRQFNTMAVEDNCFDHCGDDTMQSPRPHKSATTS